MKRNLHACFYSFNNCFMTLSVSHDFKNPQISFGKTKFGKMNKRQFHQQIFSLILKCMVYEFCGCTRIFKELMRIF